MDLLFKPHSEEVDGHVEWSVVVRGLSPLIDWLQVEMDLFDD